MTAEEKAGQLVAGLDLCDCPHVAKEDCDGCRLEVAITAAIREAEAAAVAKERKRCAALVERQRLAVLGDATDPTRTEHFAELQNDIRDLE